MYKKIGIRFEKNDRLEDQLVTKMATLVGEYKRTNEHFAIPENKQRHFYRAPIDPRAENGLKLWIQDNERGRYVRTELNDLSAGGAGIVIPYKTSLKVGDLQRFILDIDGVTYYVFGNVRFVKDLYLPTKYRKLLEQVIKEIHPDDVSEARGL